MADQPRDPRRRPRPETDSARPVMPPTAKLPANPHDLADMQLAPGDPYIQAAYQRVNKTTAQLNNALGPAVREAEGNDALMIQKLAKRSRVVTFNVQGIVWKAGFCKELSQSPVGVAFNFPMLPMQEVAHGGAMLRPVDPSMELIFRDLIPRALMEADEKMYGMTRLLVAIAMYFVPREDGAVCGIIAQYGDSPTSRSHYMFLQTAIRKADPRVLDQMLQTFQAALPRVQESLSQPRSGDFWQELERSLYQVRATYRTSALHEQSSKVKSQLTTRLQQTGDGVEKALGAVDQAGAKLEWLLNLPLKGLLFVLQGVSNGLVGAIRLLDRMMRR
ncbi:hypothetical protein J7643_05680 [bacterium]|nr:hypothetical protein [bacterium]